MIMGVMGWIVLGVIAGYIAGTQVNKDGEGLPMKIGVGITGAVTVERAKPSSRTFRPKKGTKIGKNRKVRARTAHWLCQWGARPYCTLLAISQRGAKMSGTCQ